VSQAAEKIAALYDWRCSRGGSTKDYEPFAAADVTLLAGQTDFCTARLCDAGCGNGIHLRALTDAGVNYPVGVDLSKESLRNLLATDLADSIILVNADFTTWRIGPIFHAVICSLPVISEVEGYDLRTILSALQSMTKQGGCILLKLFDSERVQDITGTFSVIYDGTTSEKVSRISHAPGHRSIDISQHYADTPHDTRRETIDTPTRDEVYLEAQAVGMRAKSIDHHMELPGTRTYLLRISAE